MQVYNNLDNSNLNSIALTEEPRNLPLINNSTSEKISFFVSNENLLVGTGVGGMSIGYAVILTGAIIVNPATAIVGAIVMLAGGIFTISIIVYNDCQPNLSKQPSLAVAINYNPRPADLADEVGKLCDIGYKEFDHKIHVLLARIADAYNKKEINIHQAKKMINQLYANPIMGSRLQLNRRLTNCIKPIEKEFMGLELDAALQMNYLYRAGFTGKKEELFDIFEEVLQKYENFAYETEGTSLQDKYEKLCEVYRFHAPELFAPLLDTSPNEEFSTEDSDSLVEGSHIESSDGVSFGEGMLQVFEMELKYAAEWIDFYKEGIIEFEELSKIVKDFFDKYEAHLSEVPLSLGQKCLNFYKAYQEIEQTLSRDVNEASDEQTKMLKRDLKEMFQCVKLYRRESGYKEEVLDELQKFIEQSELAIQASGNTKLTDKFQLLKENYFSILTDSLVEEEPQETLVQNEKPKTLNQELMAYTKKRLAKNKQLGDQVLDDIEAKINNQPAYLPQIEPIAFKLSPVQAREIDDSPKQQAICLLSQLISILKRCLKTIESFESEVGRMALAESAQAIDEVDLNAHEWTKYQYEEAQNELNMTRRELCKKLDCPITTEDEELISLSEKLKQEIKADRADLSRFEQIEDDYCPWIVEDIPAL